MIQPYDNPLPDGWNERPLKEVTVRKRGYSWDKEQETTAAESGAVPVIRIPNVGDSLDLQDLLHLRGVSEEALKQSAVSKDWILFVASNGNPERIGDSVLIAEDREMVFASFLLGIKPKNLDALLPEFLARWMRLHNVHEAFSKTSQQTTGLANFSWSAVKKLPMRFPADLAEQQAIISVLRSVDEAIAKTKDEIEATRRLKKAWMQQLFTRGLPGRHTKFVKTKWLAFPEGWKLKPLKSLASVTSGFTMGRDLSGYERITVPYVTVVNVQEGYFDLENVSTAEIKLSEIESDTLQVNDVLMTEGGDRDKLGRGAIWRGEVEPCAFQNHIFRIRFYGDVEDAYSPELFHFLLQTYQAKNYFYTHAKQTSNLCTINSRELKKFPVAVPEPDEQQEMLNILVSMDACLDALQMELDALYKLKTSLLQNLLTGKVRVKAEVSA